MQNLTQNLTPWEICAITIGGLLALAEAVNIVGSAWEKISKARAAAKAPSTAQNDRLDKLETDRDNIMRFLDNDKRSIEALNEGNRVIQRALLALMAHAIDGNNVHQLEEAEKSLHAYLIDRQH